MPNKEKKNRGEKSMGVNKKKQSEQYFEAVIRKFKREPNLQTIRFERTGTVGQFVSVDIRREGKFRVDSGKRYLSW